MRWRRIVVLLVPLTTTLATACVANLDGFTGGASDAGPESPRIDGATTDSSVNEGVVSNDAGADGTSDAQTSPVFFDDFNRSDGPDIGNGWLMKHPPAFALLGGVVERRYPDAEDFNDNIVYRPVGESVLDVEVSIELHLAQATTSGFPQLHARVQSSVTAAGQLDSYFLYVHMATNELVVARQHGGANGFTGLGSIHVSPIFNTSDTYRLRLRVTGTSPVALTGVVEKQVGGAFTLIGQTSAADSDAAKIVTPGTVGFSGGVPESSGLYRYDNFTRTAL